MSINPENLLTLDEAVDEVLGLLTGLDLAYDPNHDRFRAVARQLNRALRLNALEQEWSYYHSELDLGPVAEGDSVLHLSSNTRVRQIGDDSVRLVDDLGNPFRWAYFLPRDALSKYRYSSELRCSVLRNMLLFSRPINLSEAGLHAIVPVMREPTKFRIPAMPADPNAALVPIPDEVLNQPLDFQYPDVITMRAAFLYAQTDPVMQPRVQTLEAQYKDLMYQVMERDNRNTDSPLLNDWNVPIMGSLHGPMTGPPHPHAHWYR